MKFSIYGKRFEPAYAKHVEHLFNALIRRGVKVSVYEKFYRFIQDYFHLPETVTTFTREDDIKDTSFLISVGGDGTLLDTVTIIKDTKIPILGLNTGRLGFLSHVDVEEIERAIESLINGDYTLDKRSLIEVRSSDQQFGDFPYALNEVTILNKERNSMITVHAYVNDMYMSTYWADGLIIATPTGSTAYNLSCGGPIVTPDSNNLIITPVAPHNLNVRPIILSNSNKISLRAEGREPQSLLTIDSKSYALDRGSSLELTKANFEINLVSLEGQDFFHTIRNKMGWGVDRRN
jgi:NAD+ kinase